MSWSFFLTPLEGGGRTRRGWGRGRGEVGGRSGREQEKREGEGRKRRWQGREGQGREGGRNLRCKLVVTVLDDDLIRK